MLEAQDGSVRFSHRFALPRYRSDVVAKIDSSEEFQKVLDTIYADDHTGTKNAIIKLSQKLFRDENYTSSFSDACVQAAKQAPNGDFLSLAVSTTPEALAVGYAVGIVAALRQRAVNSDKVGRIIRDVVEGIMLENAASYSKSDSGANSMIANVVYDYCAAPAMFDQGIKFALQIKSDPQTVVRLQMNGTTAVVTANQEVIGTLPSEDMQLLVSPSDSRIPEVNVNGTAIVFAPRSSGALSECLQTLASVLLNLDTSESTFTVPVYLVANRGLTPLIEAKMMALDQSIRPLGEVPSERVETKVTGNASQDVSTTAPAPGAVAPTRVVDDSAIKAAAEREEALTSQLAESRAIIAKLESKVAALQKSDRQTQAVEVSNSVSVGIDGDTPKTIAVEFFDEDSVRAAKDGFVLEWTEGSGDVRRALADLSTKTIEWLNESGASVSQHSKFRDVREAVGQIQVKLNALPKKVQRLSSIAQMQARAEKAERELQRRPKSAVDHTLEERATKAESRAAELEARLAQLERELQSFNRDRHATSVVHQAAVDDVRRRIDDHSREKNREVERIIEQTIADLESRSKVRVEETIAEITLAIDAREKALLRPLEEKLAAVDQKFDAELRDVQSMDEQSRIAMLDAVASGTAQRRHEWGGRRYKRQPY